MALSATLRPSRALRGCAAVGATLCALLSATLWSTAVYAVRPLLRPDGGVPFVGDHVAMPRGALSLSNQAAGLVDLGGPEYRLQLSTGAGVVGEEAGAAWGLFAATRFGRLRVGGAVEGVEQSSTSGGSSSWLLPSRLTLGCALPLSDTVSFGAQVRAMSGLDSWPTSVGAGVLWRPWSWLSMGASVDSISSSASVPTGYSPMRPRWRMGVALRPIAGSDRLALALDLRWRSGGAAPSPSFGLMAQVIEGLTLSGQVSASPYRDEVTGQEHVDTRVGLAVELGFGRLGAEVALRGDELKGTSAGTAGGLQVGLRWSHDTPPSLTSGGEQAVVVALKGAMSEDAMDGARFLRLLIRLERLAQQPDLKLVVLRADNAAFTWSQVEDLQRAIDALHRAGKKTAWYGASAGTRGYAVAALCSKVGMPDTGSLTASGIGADFVGLAAALTRVGVQVEAIRYEDHKSAPEMFTRSSISKELKETLSRIVRRRWRSFAAAVRRGRRLSTAQLDEAMRRGVVSPIDAKAAGLIDVVASPREFELHLRRWGLLPADAKLRLHRPIARRRRRWGPRPRIAVVTVNGMIVNGKHSRGPMGAQTGGAATAALLRRLAHDPSVRGVMMRIDSGGGAVWGSDEMYQAALVVKRRKPMVASMATVAASGGYWAALGADTIFAGDATITGSIGIWMAKPNVSKALEKWQIGVDRVAAGPLPFAMSLKSRWSQEERLLLQRSLRYYYDLFLSRVSQRRRLSRKALSPLAGGRLWLGDEAKRHGLVDHRGGFTRALGNLLSRAEASEPPEVVFVPSASWTTRLRRTIGGGRVDRAVVIARWLAGPWLDEASVLASLPKGQPLALTPVVRSSSRP